MKNFIPWSQGSRCYEQLRVVDDMSDSNLWAQASRYYDYLRAVIDLNDFGSWVKALDAMNRSGL